MQILTSCLALLLLLACTSPPSHNDVVRAEIGDPPTAAEITVGIAAAMDAILFDPDSAKSSYGQPERGWYSPPGFGSPKFAWVVQGRCNAKNRFGAYVGYRPSMAWFLRGQIVAFFLAENDHGSGSVVEINGGGLTREAAGLNKAMPGETR